jgi:hypothetical protein
MQTRVQVRTANDCENDETLQASASTSQATSTDRASLIVLPEDEINQDYDQFHDEDNDHPGPATTGGDENNTGDPMSSITDDDRVDMITPHQKMMKLLFEQQAEWREERKPERERMPAQWDAERELMAAERRPTRQSSNDPTMFKMVDRDQYCGCISKLDNFLSILPGSFQSHSNLFSHGGPSPVQYALNFLRSWSSHVNPTQRNTQMEDPIAWGQKLRRTNHPAMNGFDLFDAEFRKTYGDKDREMHVAMGGFQEFHQGQHDTEEGVRAYANRVRALWRETGLDEQHFQKMLYEIAWTRMRPGLPSRIAPLVNRRFGSIDERFDRAVDVQFQPRPGHGKTGGQQQQQHHRQPGESSKKGDKKRKFRPSILEPSTNDKSGKHGGNRPRLPPAPLASKQHSENRVASGKCTRCGRDHITNQCPKFSRPLYPDSNLSTGGQQVKRQQSFVTQQSKNSFTSPGT